MFKMPLWPCSFNSNTTRLDGRSQNLRRPPTSPLTKVEMVVEVMSSGVMGVGGGMLLQKQRAMTSVVCERRTNVGVGDGFLFLRVEAKVDMLS